MRQKVIFWLLIPFIAVAVTGCGKKTIVNDVGQKEANEILVLMASVGIDGEKVEAASGGAGGGGAPTEPMYDIQVPSSDAIDAMALLNRYGLPRKKGTDLLEVFSKQGLVPSEKQENIRYQAGLQEQIASVIRKIDGVIDANVMLSFPKEEDLPGLEKTEEQKKKKVTASVYVKHQGVIDDPNTHLVSKIKRFVASSVTGLDFENVTVVSDKARYTDITLEQMADRFPEDEKDYRRVWGIVVAKESLTRFRVIFFSMSILLILMMLSLGWVLWKLFPYLKSREAMMQMLRPDPFDFTLVPEEEEDPPQESEAEAPPPEGEKAMGDAPAEPEEEAKGEE